MIRECIFGAELDTVSHPCSIKTCPCSHLDQEEVLISCSGIQNDHPAGVSYSPLMNRDRDMRLVSWPLNPVWAQGCPDVVNLKPLLMHAQQILAPKTED